MDPPSPRFHPLRPTRTLYSEPAGSIQPPRLACPVKRAQSAPSLPRKRANLQHKACLLPSPPQQLPLQHHPHSSRQHLDAGQLRDLWEELGADDLCAASDAGSDSSGGEEELFELMRSLEGEIYRQQPAAQRSCTGSPSQCSFLDCNPWSCNEEELTGESAAPPQLEAEADQQPTMVSQSVELVDFRVARSSEQNSPMIDVQQSVGASI